MSNDGEHPQVKQVNVSAHQAPAAGTRAAGLLPAPSEPVISVARAGSQAADALLAIVTGAARPRAFASLPESARWRELHAREPPRPGTVRSTTLGERRHTLAVLGYLDGAANSFERLALAGRMLKETAARRPEVIALAAAGGTLAARAALEALLAAALAHAFALPSFRALRERERRIRRIVLMQDAGIDLRYAAAAARGTNLARWLTALPPNMTGACVYSLTERMSGAFANRPRLARLLEEAGRVSGERVWSFPLEADIVQCTVDGKDDHILAARFLSRFVPPDTPRAHIDRSAATRSGGLAHVATDVTGFGVRFALELLPGQRVLKELRARRQTEPHG